MTAAAALDGYGDDAVHMSRIEVPVRVRRTLTIRIGRISSFPRLSSCRVNAVDHLPSKLDTTLATRVAGDSPNGPQQLVPLSYLSGGKSPSILGQALVCLDDGSQRRAVLPAQGPAEVGQPSHSPGSSHRGYRLAQGVCGGACERAYAPVAVLPCCCATRRSVISPAQRAEMRGDISGSNG
jgi:hypothetical protein